MKVSNKNIYSHFKLVVFVASFAFYSFIYFKYEDFYSSQARRIIRSKPLDSAAIGEKGRIRPEDQRYWADALTRKPVNFTYIIEPTVFDDYDRCAEDCSYEGMGSGWRMAVLVKSRLAHVYHRDFVRRTWGAIRHLGGATFTVVFVVGADARLNPRRIVDEAEEYGDVLQFDGADDYVGVANKTLAGMQWAATRLPSSYMYASADDDLIVNMLKWTRVVDESVRLAADNRWPSPPILCVYRIAWHLDVARNVDSKWYVPYREYRWPKFPKSCLGALYSTSVAVARRLWEVARTRPAVRTDDMWLTGEIRQQSGMPDRMLYDASMNRTIVQHCQSYNVYFRGVHAKRWRRVYRSFADVDHCVCRRHVLL